MRTYEKKMRECEVLVELSCDLCGAKAGSGGDWTTGGYEQDETEVRHRKGISYPEGGSGTECKVDICPKCFEEKLIPWLESQGCKAKYEDWEW